MWEPTKPAPPITRTRAPCQSTNLLHFKEIIVFELPAWTTEIECTLSLGSCKDTPVPCQSGRDIMRVLKVTFGPITECSLIKTSSHEN